MLRTRVMPCLLVKNGRLVKTVKFKKTGYVGDPINAIKIYNEKEVDELIVLDITATTEKREPNFQLIGEIAKECFMPLCYGGGVKDIETMRKIFNLGVEKISLNSASLSNKQFIQEASKIFGSQSIILSIDVKRNLFGKYYVVKNGRTNTRINPVEFASQMVKYGVGEILLNSTDRDGTWEGYDLKLIEMVSSSVDVPVIACGGAGKIKDFRNAVVAGASAAAAGSMFVYQGKDLGVLIKFPKQKELREIFSDIEQ